jgi:hypothetical protein
VGSIYPLRRQATPPWYDRTARQCGEEKPLNYESMEGAEEAAKRAEAEYAYALTHGPTQPKPRSAPGYYGVSADKKRWVAYINYGGKHHRLGTFDTKQEAALAYDKTARQCGEEKPLNYESMEGAEEAAKRAQAEYALTHDPTQPKLRPAPSRRPRSRTTERRGSAGRRSP